MPSLPLSYENLASATTKHPSTKPIFMLNLWRFRPTALYAPEHAHLSPSPCTGEEAMTRYRLAMRSILPPNTVLHFTSVPVTSVAAPEGETWDFVAIVKYENLGAFREMVECKEYREEVEPHRVAALEDYRLVMLDEVQVE
ncbi:hypothetical protein CC86DRAFT_125176 [Ophiobolus disseminans]|uniref:DUF1330 domain-containing protein n=1 Tax=Ophiobolus disseminans TaxID=1469910 RepID=A0A6A6ZGG3_9PLEO|nr:hypothetical protein CC86DRAFT_125176 [Ophiobolus disseminans]